MIKIKEKIPLYNIYVHVVAGNLDDQDDVIKFFTNQGIDNAVSMFNMPCGAVTVYAPDIAFFGIAYFVEDGFVKISDFTHEIFHLTTMVLSHVGMKHCDESDEAYSYLNGYLNQKILERLNKKGVRFKI